MQWAWAEPSSVTPAQTGSPSTRTSIAPLGVPASSERTVAVSVSASAKLDANFDEVTSVAVTPVPTVCSKDAALAVKLASPA